jgi:hypothetical protein
MSLEESVSFFKSEGVGVIADLLPSHRHVAQSAICRKIMPKQWARMRMRISANLSHPKAP